MNMITADAIRDFMLEHLSAAIAAKGFIAADLKDDFDLLDSGVVDSLGILEMISAVEQRFRVSVDFERMDPGAITTIGPFCCFVVENGVFTGSKYES